MLFILVVGLIIVALMVYTSTRIKRVSAEAFGEETIETDEFAIRKPVGWLSLAEPRSGLAFDAYTKEFNPEPDDEIRLGTANVALSKATIDDAVAHAIVGATTKEDLREVVGDVHYRVLDLEREDNDRTCRERVKLGEQDGTVYTLTIKTLAETTEEFRRDIEGMIDSFELK